MIRSKARARAIAERTGKPHLYVYNGVKTTEWLWEDAGTLGECSDAEDNHLAAWCTRMDRIMGYMEFSDETNS